MSSPPPSPSRVNIELVSAKINRRTSIGDTTIYEGLDAYDIDVIKDKFTAETELTVFAKRHNNEVELPEKKPLRVTFFSEEGVAIPENINAIGKVMVKEIDYTDDAIINAPVIDDAAARVCRVQNFLSLTNPGNFVPSSLSINQFLREGDEVLLTFVADRIQSKYIHSLHCMLCI
jgi:hypothetical protein